MPIIYRKTEKGLTEVKTRQHGLAMRARGALILVDGKRDHDSLLGMIVAPAEATLALLLEQGFIDVSLSGTGSAAAPSSQAPAAARQPAAAASRAVEPGGDLAARCRAAVRDLNETLGPSGESLAIRMERARDVAELTQVVQMAAQVISNLRGRSVAEAYARRHGA